jgi:hypothetical protein
MKHQVPAQAPPKERTCTNGKTTLDAFVRQMAPQSYFHLNAT